LTALATHYPDPPRSISAAVPVALSDLIMHLLEKDPAARPGSAGEVADSLARIERALCAAAAP